MRKTNKIIGLTIGGLLAALFLLSASLVVFSLPCGENKSATSVDFNNCKQVVGNGKIASKSAMVAAFDSISLGGKFDVNINAGQQPKVVITSDENILPYIDVVVADKKLTIDTQSGVLLQPSKTNQATITTPTLYNISLGGKVNLRATNINSDHLVLSLGGKSTGELQGNIKQLQLNLGGKSELHINVGQADAINLNIGGKGVIYLTGAVNNLQITVGGKAKIIAKNLLANNVAIRGAGQTHISIHAIKKLAIMTAGKTDVEYYGNPSISKMSFGETNIKKMNNG